LEIRGEEHDEESKTSVTASVRCEWRQAWAARSFAYHARTLTTHCLLMMRSSLRSSPQTLEQKGGCSQSMSSTKKFACNIREQLFLY